MTQIQSTDGSAKKYKKHNLKIDMTPMVDLGFLLITFFIFTASMSESKGMNLYMPVDGPVNNQPESKALTVLLKGSDSIYYYSGKWQDAISGKNLRITNYDVHNGLGKIIREKQKALGIAKDELMLMIKPTDASTYNNIINLLDEVQINAIKKYAILELSPEEKAFLEQ